MTEIYFSTDIESDGPLPGPNSMLSFGSAAFLPDGKILDTFYRNLELLPGAVQDKNTMDFWSKNQEAYNLTRQNLVQPTNAMYQYTNWIETLCKSEKARPVFVGYPATFDFNFVYTLSH